MPPVIFAVWNRTLVSGDAQLSMTGDNAIRRGQVFAAEALYAVRLNDPGEAKGVYLGALFHLCRGQQRQGLVPGDRLLRLDDCVIRVSGGGFHHPALYGIIGVRLVIALEPAVFPHDPYSGVLHREISVQRYHVPVCNEYIRILSGLAHREAGARSVPLDRTVRAVADDPDRSDAVLCLCQHLLQTGRPAGRRGRRYEKRRQAQDTG